MVSAINASTFVLPVNAGVSTGGLEARLERYQKELADCVNCDSAKTLEGKQKIQDVSGKISEIKARIEEIAVARSKPAGNAVAVSTARAADAIVGSRLDVFA